MGDRLSVYGGGVGEKGWFFAIRPAAPRHEKSQMNVRIDSKERTVDSGGV